MRKEDDFAHQPVPGLPEQLPEGEQLIWQGRPNAWALARDSLAVKWIAGYFVLLAIWRGTIAAESGGFPEAAGTAISMLVFGFAACGILYLCALVQARNALYTITNRRVALRIGAIATLTLNLPFRELETAGLALNRDGTGTIALTMKSHVGLSYLICWPHVRPWRMSRVEPALRSIPDAERVAGILAEAAETRISEPQIGRSAHAAVPAE